MNRHFYRAALWTVCFLTITGRSIAGGGYIINDDGTPRTWDNSSSVVVNPETGDCASFSNEEMRQKISDNMSHWTGLTQVDLDIELSAFSMGGVDACNYADYLVAVTGTTDESSAAAISDAYHPILFDNDGEIIAAVAGESNRYNVLGFANPTGFVSDTNEIIDGQAVFNCRCLEGNPNDSCISGAQQITFTEDELDFTMVHEMGHFLNLDHTEVNDELVNNSNSSDDDNIPTMYPISISADLQITPTEDDAVALGSLYPASNFFVSGDSESQFCRVTGTLQDSEGNDLRCADVQATTSDEADTISFISGAYAEAADANGDGDSADDGECTSGCGNFQLFLQPGKDYSVIVKPVKSSFTSGSGISPCAYHQLPDCCDYEEYNDNIACTQASQDCSDSTSDSFGADCSTESINDSDGNPTTSCVLSQTVESISAADCSAGSTITLGTVVTDSTVFTSSSASVSAPLGLKNDTLADAKARALVNSSNSKPLYSTDCPESDDGSSSGASSGGCSLNANAVAAAPRAIGLFIRVLLVIPVMAVLLIRGRAKKSRFDKNKK